MSDRPEWFAPKRYGLGSGLPIAWQGWAVLIGFGVVTIFGVQLFGPHDWRSLTIVIPATIALMIICALTTKGGWRWRWGEDE